MSENNIFDYCSATPQKTNSFSNFHAMAFRNKIHFLPLILILFCCVENRIFIQLHPDGQTYFRFESRGDSADVFDQDFLHPRDFPGWATSAKVVEKDDNKNWIVSTEGLLQDTLILFFQGDEIPLGYSFARSASETWFSAEYTFALTFTGRKIKKDYPKLYEALLSKKSDSLTWLPEALTVLMHKGLNDLSQNSLSPSQTIWNRRLVNHLRNSFARINTMEDLERIQNDRELFLANLLQPFKVDPELPGELALAMEKHEKVLESTLDLNDDSFELKVIMPGQPVFTNANMVNHDTLIWNFGLDSLLSDSYTLNAKSVIYTTDQYQKTLISIGILFLILMAILIKRRF